MQVLALEKTVISGSESYPIYIGFLKAEELLRVAEVPNFKKNTPNSNIATNVLTPPVQEWQRPLIEEKKEKIVKTFDGTGEFMPNPVLLAERCIGGSPSINITDYKVAGITTPIKVIDILMPIQGQSLPLWIIDGQHRISGLGDPNCVQKDNFIPVVLLLNNGGTFYNGRNLAKIFAQVTTEATPLAQLHKEWLTFAFKLDSYPLGSPSYNAMETIANLCRLPHNSVNNKMNGFHDDIQFNDELSTSPKYLGHQYDCKDLSSTISKYYYSETSLFPHLGPQDLANQISMAFECLKRCVRAPHEKTVFFGDKKHAHKIMIDAYLVGVFSYLRNVNGRPTQDDWDRVLTDLKFNTTDWNFQQYVNTSSRWVDKSKNLAFDVFSYIFKNASLPSGVTDVWDYLSGDQLYIEIEFRHVNVNENSIIRNKVSAKYGRGDKKTFPMDQRKYFRVIDRSINAKHIEIFDAKSSPVDPVVFKTSGEYLCLPKVDPGNTSQDPLVLTVKCTLYGGNEEKMTITLSGWK